MERKPMLLLYVSVILASGCGAQSALLGTEGTYLFTAMDALAVPSERVALRARLQGGDLLRAQPGLVVRFYRDRKLFKAAQTDDEGLATVSFTPQKPGDYIFTVDIAPVGFSDRPPPSQELRVTSRGPQTPILIVDLDKTVVASGFQEVLVGDPEAMVGAAELLRDLSNTHTIVYLTHRPDYFGPKSKAWLWANGFPAGPVLLSSVSGFFSGSGQYKSQMLRQLQARFKNIEIGIGDKVSDALAYHENGIRAFLIYQVPTSDDPNAFEGLADELSELPKPVQVVTGWYQIRRVIFENASFGASIAQDRLRGIAQVRRREIEASQ